MNQPKLIVLGGFAGAGKTTIATKLAQTYSFPVFSTDSVNDALRPLLNKEFHEVSPISYGVVWHLIRDQLKLGVTIILDSNMASTRTWESLDELKIEFPDIIILPIILRASLDNHRRRIEERGSTNKSHLNLGGDKIEDVLFKYEFIEKLERPDIISIDANRSPAEVYDDVVAAIDDSSHTD